MRSTLALLCLFSFLIMIPVCAATADVERALGHSEIGPFLRRHCASCHSRAASSAVESQRRDKTGNAGPSSNEAAVDAFTLDSLAVPSAAGAVRETWARVLEVIEHGEMPPPRRPRPSPAAIDRWRRLVLDHLTRPLHSRPLALRRLNRVEYENTVHDLLGIDTPLADLLPEDGSVQGFDNVADGLGISSILMERYLEAADVAFESVIRRVKPLPPATRRSVVMQAKENIDSVKQKKGGTIQVGESFVKFTPGWPPVRIDAAHPIEDGVYRCRIAVWPHEPSQRTLAVAIYVGPLFGPGKRRLMGVYDVTGTPDQPRIIEFTTRMREGHTMHIVPQIYPVHITYRDKHEPRPGIGVVWAETHGPLDQAWPAESQRKLFGDADSLQMIEDAPIYIRHRRGVRRHVVESTAPRRDLERIIRGFVPRAFRRPVDRELAQPYVDLALQRLEAGRTFEQALRAGVTAVLCSPQFLLVNREPQVDDYTVASRLSYFLWSTMPDEQLLQLASTGELRDPRVQHQQVERMLKDPRSEQFVSHFIGQWLKQREISFTTPDNKLYPEFDDLLQAAMLGETRHFFEHVLENDLSALNFVDSDFALLNERLASHYGIPGVKGHEHFRVVQLPEESIRGGVMAQASVLKVTANGTSTSPILRGVWVLDNLLGEPAPPPPPGVPAVEPDIRGATTIREQLDKHRAIESCARCHRRIDPAGIAMESFDPIGGERSRYRSLGEGEKVRNVRYRLGPDVETDGVTENDRAFSGFRQYQALLLEDPERIARAVARKLLVYGTGRPVTIAEQDAVQAVVDASRDNNYGLRTMIHAVVASDLFTQP